MKHLPNTLLYGKHLIRKAGRPLLILLFAGGATLKADTISSNLAATTADVEVASDSTWLTASFGTGSSSNTLANVTLLLSNPVSGVAEVDLYSNDLLEPGSLVATLTSPTAYTSSLSDITFSGNGFALSTNSTYWVVLKALSGEFDWAWTSDTTGTGTGFQGVWGISSDAGNTWFTYAVYPTQFSVTTNEAAATTPELGTGWLSAGGLLIGITMLHLFNVHTRSEKRKGDNV